MQRLLDEDPTLIDQVWHRRGGGDLVRHNTGKQLVHVAAEGGHVEILKLLKNRGASVRVRNELDHSHQPIHYAAWNGHAKAVEWLLDNGATIDPADSFYGNTPLHYAAAFVHLDTLDVLLARGADVNKKCSTLDYSMTPLQALCRSAHSRDPQKAHVVAKKLLDKGADVNARDDKGMTALDHASGGEENKVLTKVLIDYRAKVKTGN